MTLRIVADENMPGLEAFESLGQVRRVNGRTLTCEDLSDVDVLLVRSVTRVDAALLDGTPVRFVGSATIGTDHVDQRWLAHQGIRFRHAPGCNAMAVAEYVLQATLVWILKHEGRPDELSLGVIGCGNVGGRVACLGEALGMKVMCCDPPRVDRGEAVTGRTVSLEEVLSADVVSLHVPLTRGGDDSTHHLFSAPQLDRLTAQQLLINTSRGAVVDNRALEERLRDNGPSVVLDVWEGEPRPLASLFQRVALGTPHIAGHSREGKQRGTRMLYSHCLEWLGHQPAEVAVTAPAAVYPGNIDSIAELLALLRARYDIRRDHRALASAMAEPDPGEAFDRLRRDYPPRHECAGLHIEGRVAADLRPVLDYLGVCW